MTGILDGPRQGCNDLVRRARDRQDHDSPRPDTAGASSSPGVEMARHRTRVCAEPGCPELTTGGRCPTHRAQVERARGTRQQRGYDAEHDRLRRWWKPKVEAVTVHCHAERCVEPSGRLILPYQAWDLGHLPDRSGWTGPEHSRCNRAAGGRAAHGG
jgi:hypothetical protein